MNILNYLNVYSLISLDLFKNLSYKPYAVKSYVSYIFEKNILSSSLIRTPIK